MYMQTLYWTEDLAGAARTAVELERAFSDYPDEDIQEICAAALVRASAYYARLGNPEAGMSLLNQVEQRYPGRHEKRVSHYRAFCEEAIRSQEAAEGN
jgi:hypothetical protein